MLTKRSAAPGNEITLCMDASRLASASVVRKRAALPEEVGQALNCIMVEAINQSGTRIFLGVKMEEIVARGMKRISLPVFSALTSLVI